MSGNGARKGSDLLVRTKQFALRIIRLFRALPKTVEAQVLGRQLLKSGTSVGAHCREGNRARSTPEFISKLNGGLMELEETTYWIELLIDAEIFSKSRLGPLHREANELTAILVASLRTAGSKQRKKTSRS